jgi:hypothetical protein
MRKNNDSGKYVDAVSATIDDGEANAPALFGKVDADIGRAIDASNGTLDAQATSAGSALTGLAIGTGLLVLLAMAGLTVGYQRRIAEYR